MEIWDIYDINMQKTGKTTKRGERLKENEYHLVVCVCIFNKDGEMLIQQRQKDKIGWPNRWDLSAAGSVVHGEDSRSAIQRELKEELGIDIVFSSLRPILTVNFSRGFTDYYCIEKDVDINSLKLQKEEVQNVKWADKETILNMIDKEEFIPYYKSLIYCLFEMRNSTGSHIRDGFNKL
ncbi:MAG: NUDIX domain-containing protein [Eubacteriales bacterium]